MVERRRPFREYGWLWILHLLPCGSVLSSVFPKSCRGRNTEISLVGLCELHSSFGSHSRCWLLRIPPFVAQSIRGADAIWRSSLLRRLVECRDVVELLARLQLSGIRLDLSIYLQTVVENRWETDCADLLCGTLSSRARIRDLPLSAELLPSEYDSLWWIECDSRCSDSEYERRNGKYVVLVGDFCRTGNSGLCDCGGELRS